MPIEDRPSDRALTGLLAELAPGLLRYCRARTGDPSLAEEVAQEALTALVTRWRRKGPPDSPAAFVFTVARRRAGRRLAQRRLTAPLEALGVARAAEPDPEERTAERQRLVRVREMLGELSSREREALLLAVAGDLDTATAARTLGISKSAYKMRLHRARRRLERLTEAVTPAHGPLEVSDESTP